VKYVVFQTLSSGEERYHLPVAAPIAKELEHVFILDVGGRSFTLSKTNGTIYKVIPAEGIVRLLEDVLGAAVSETVDKPDPVA